jgi:hypothetical protein
MKNFPEAHTQDCNVFYNEAKKESWNIFQLQNLNNIFKQYNIYSVFKYVNFIDIATCSIVFQRKSHSTTFRTHYLIERV